MKVLIMSMKKLKKTAKRLELKIVKKSMTKLKVGRKSVDIATLDGVADIPATDYHKGVDVGLINYRSNGGELQSGVYKLRISAIGKIRERGRHPAIAQFVDANGRSVSSQRIDLDVFSADVPHSRRFDQAVFSLESRFSEGMDGGYTPATIIIVFWCSNGTHGVIII
jgi:hypothetical protein